MEEFNPPVCYAERALRCDWIPEKPATVTVAANEVKGSSSKGSFPAALT